MAVGKPRVVYREVNGEKCEPYEILTVDLEDDTQGVVMEELGRRRGELTNMESDGNGCTRRISYSCAWTHWLSEEFLTMTRGTGLMSHIFDEYAPANWIFQAVAMVC